MLLLSSLLQPGLASSSSTAVFSVLSTVGERAVRLGGSERPRQRGVCPGLFEWLPAVFVGHLIHLLLGAALQRNAILLCGAACPIVLLVLPAGQCDRSN